MLALMIRYAVSVIYYEPYIYGKPVPDVWFRNIGQVRMKFHEILLKNVQDQTIQFDDILLYF